MDQSGRSDRRAGQLCKLVPWARVARGARDLDRLLYREIAERRKVAAGRVDVMSMLIQAVDEEGRGLSDEELRDEMMVLLIGGHKRRPRRCRGRWRCALGIRKFSRRSARNTIACLPAASSPPVLPSSRTSMRWLKKLSGSTRSLPPSPGARQPLTIAGYSLPEGVLVSPSIYHIQRDPNVWPDPMRFDPSRFTEKRPRPSEWLPFGGGVRTCLGMAFAMFEMRIVLSTVLRRTKLRPQGEIPRLSQRGILLGPAGPIRVTVESVD